MLFASHRSSRTACRSVRSDAIRFTPQQSNRLQVGAKRCCSLHTQLTDNMTKMEKVEPAERAVPVRAKDLTSPRAQYIAERVVNVIITLNTSLLYLLQLIPAIPSQKEWEMPSLSRALNAVTQFRGRKARSFVVWARCVRHAGRKKSPVAIQQNAREASAARLRMRAKLATKLRLSTLSTFLHVHKTQCIEMSIEMRLIKLYYMLLRS
jgi:hypothetical protein